MEEMIVFSQYVLNAVAEVFSSGPLFYLFGLILLMFIIKYFKMLL